MPKETPEKLDLRSMDITDEKKQQLKQLFPEVFREDKVDFDHLKRVLGEWVDPGKERFGLQWPGKAECMKTIQQPSIATLRPDREESVNFDDTEHLFIEGDNLEVLKLLQKSYFGKVKLIYIDPPYNTGKEFIYPDDYSESLDTYLKYTGQKDLEGNWQSSNKETQGRFHSKWLNMMYPRLFLAKNLLKDDGVIFISIDDHEMSHLKKLCDEIYGEENFIACIANINNPKGRSDDKYVATSHEYILMYTKNETSYVGLGFEPEKKITKRYNKTDKDGKLYREIDLRKTGDNDLREDRPNLFYYFYYNQDTHHLYPSRTREAPEGYHSIIPLRADGKEGNWRWEMDTAKEKLSRLKAKFMPNREIWGVFEKDYLHERGLVKPTSSWTFKDVNSERGSETFINLGFDKRIFPKPKPIGTIKRLCQISSASNDKDIILDFFAGSCSSAHAILEKNFSDKGGYSVPN